MGTLKEIRTTLFNDPSKMDASCKSGGSLRTPKEARKEVETLRDQLADFRNYKD